MMDGMLFVRTGGACAQMIRASMLLAMAAVAASLAPAPAVGAFRTVDVSVYPDGTAHISASADADPLEAGSLELDLMAREIDNFVAVGDGGFLLESEISDGTARVDAFGSPSVAVEYDAHDLVSKQGRVWTFVADAPSQLALLLPAGAAIVGMDGLPESIEVEDGRTRVWLPAGPVQVSYIVGAAEPAPDLSAYYIAAAVAAAAVAGALWFKRRSRTDEQMREDDKNMLRFISENGGQVLESDLRKKFLQPRTTMWRAVKRLERQGLVTVEKRDSQNLVKLRGGRRD